MKLIMKKISKVVLGIILLFAFSLNVAAEELVTEQASLSISGVKSGDAFKAYKVLDVYYDNSSNTYNYKFTNDFASFLTTTSKYSDLTIDEYYELTSGNIENGSTQTTSTLDALMSEYASYIKKENISGSELTVNNTTASAQLPAGTYLVLPSVTTSVYAVMVGNLNYVAQNTTWKLTDASIVAKVSDISISKKVGEYKTEESYSIAEEIKYTITSTVPAYPTNATNKTYIIKDTMSEGLTFGGINNITIKDGTSNLTNDNGVFKNTSGETVATATIQGQVLTINFDVDNLTSTTLEITYKASLNDKAVVFGTGNKNGVVLEYANDPYNTSESNTGTTVTSSEETTVYTYGIKLYKYDNKNNTTGLEGAVFNVCKDVNCNQKIGEITTGEDGYGTFEGLGAGTYYLTEQKAPVGYKLLSGTTTVTIDNNATELLDISIGNSAVGILPLTGGMGTIIYITIGLALLLVATIVLVVKRNKKRA